MAISSSSSSAAQAARQLYQMSDYQGNYTAGETSTVLAGNNTVQRPISSVPPVLSSTTPGQQQLPSRQQNQSKDTTLANMGRPHPMNANENLFGTPIPLLNTPQGASTPINQTYYNNANMTRYTTQMKCMSHKCKRNAT